MKLFLIAALFLTALVVVPCLAEEEQAQEVAEKVADAPEASEIKDDEVSDAPEASEIKDDEEEASEDSNEEIPEELQDDVEQEKRVVTQLSAYSCRVLKRYGYCRIRNIARFCIRYCRVCPADKLSPLSCRRIKYTYRACNRRSGRYYCPRTCGHCHKPCNAPLGMQSGAIRNSRITASSMWNIHHGPWRARLHYRGRPGAWSAKNNTRGQWIRVDLGRPTLITGIATQGRYDYNQWVTSYYLQYSNNGIHFRNYGLLSGNRNRHTVVRHRLRHFTARFVRLVVRSWYGHISLRMELYGCRR